MSCLSVLGSFRESSPPPPPDPPLISRTCRLNCRMILAEGIERQGSKHGHELRCGPKSPTNTRGCNLRHIYLQDTCLHLGL